MRRIVIPVLVAALAAVGLASSAGATRASAASRPKAIVSLSPTATEMLFAIGAGKQVVAVGDQSNYPKNAPHTKLSEFTPNVEAVAGYQPDLVVLPDSSVAAPLRALGIEVVVQKAATTLDGTYAELLQLGKVTGHRSGAQKLVASMRQKIAKLVAAVSHRKKRPTVYYELDDTYYSADSSTFIGRLLKLAGFANIADAAGAGSGYPQLSAEYIVNANPDVIFLADTKCCNQSKATVGARPGFSDLAAVKHGHVVALDDDIASRWGPRVVQLLAVIVKASKQL
jgi:iron complex transport system substrate-binding protein